MNYLVYVGPCAVCHVETMIPENFTSGICDSCTPHVCVPELPEDDWCDFCGRTI